MHRTSKESDLSKKKKKNGVTLNLGELSTFIDIKISITTVFVFSVIAQVIIEKRAHRLVEGYVISCYNHPARGDYNTEALIFKMATA